MANRISQSVVEVLILPDAQQGRLTQDVVETVVLPDTQIGYITQIIAESTVYPDTTLTYITQVIVEALIGPPAPTPTVLPCLITINRDFPELAGYYYVLLRDYDGFVTALFDDWRSVRILRRLNQPDEFEFILEATDNRIPFFMDDARLELWRSVPGIGLDWYTEMTGLIVEHDLEVDENGDQVYRINAVGGIDLADRSEINYQAGTVRADKDAPAETAMKEYVLENIGPSATIANGRFIDGVRSGLSVDTDSAYGAIYQESNAGKKLLTVLQGISEFTRRAGFPLDFSIEPNGATGWTFYTYPGGRGADRTATGVDPSTGLNASGYPPVTFSVPNGTLSRLRYRRSRRGEFNVVTVWGDGDGSTRKYRVRSDTDRINDAPYNQRETSINASSQAFQYQLDQAGDTKLAESHQLELLDLVPLQQENQMYGLHYFLGDRVTGIEELTSFQQDKRIVEVSIEINGSDGTERISFKLD